MGENSGTGGEFPGAEEILLAEFNYAAQSAFQANEDRARVTNYYLVTVASLLAAFLSGRLEATPPVEIYWGFAVLFAVLSVAGLLTLLQLVRLRQAWDESARAMNQIKEFAIQHYKSVDLTDAFRWRMTTLPPKFKPWSIAYLLALQVSLLSSFALGTALFYTGLAYNRQMWLASVASGLAFGLLQLGLYAKLLSR